MATLLEVDQVRVEFGKLTAVNSVSFSMQGGDLLGLIGPNGAGKTTLLRVLAGLQAPTSGLARIMGHDVFRESGQVRGRVGFAPDAPPAYEELTVAQFLTYVAEIHHVTGQEAEERIDFWLEQMWLTEKREEKVRTLSKGMRQRVTIAQTLVPNPTVVLLDEPSAGLDPAGRIQLRDVIASLARQGKAVIVSSHILADLEEYCTHVGIIERGSMLRYSHVDDLAHTGQTHCKYRLRVFGDGDATELLMSVDGVAHIVRRGEEYEFEYDAGEEAASTLLKELMQRDLAVSSFAAQRDSLEDVYLKTGVRQVD